MKRLEGQDICLNLEGTKARNFDTGVVESTGFSDLVTFPGGAFLPYFVTVQLVSNTHLP